jgi:FkbM family methyltransferase
MIIISPVVKAYRNYRVKLLVKKILNNWHIKYNYKLNQEDASIIKEIFYEKIYAPYFPFHQNCTILDIGAHKGFFALYAASNCGPQSKIICLEPANSNYSILSKTINANNIQNIITINKGVASKKGKMNLYLFSAANNSTCKEYEQILNKSADEYEIIEVLTLADVIKEFELKSIDFVKIDCEGSEYDIIYHAEPKDLLKLNVISLEFHDMNDEKNNGYSLCSFLEERGFNILKFSYIQSISNLHFGNIIARNRNLLKQLRDNEIQ